MSAPQQQQQQQRRAPSAYDLIRGSVADWLLAAAIVAVLLVILRLLTMGDLVFEAAKGASG